MVSYPNIFCIWYCFEPFFVSDCIKWYHIRIFWFICSIWYSVKQCYASVCFLPETEPNLLTSSVWFGSVQSAPGRVSWVLFIYLFILFLLLLLFCFFVIIIIFIFTRNRTEPTDQFSLVRIGSVCFGSGQLGFILNF